MQWDLFCRVIDNHGDIGVCWRLAADLAERGEQVRLWVDDAAALRWMAPDGAPGVHVLPWPRGDSVIDPGDVVIEAFGCELPHTVVQRMAAAARAPVWINLEYLSAEGFVERVHLLPSPQAHGPGTGLRKWFFYPGFTQRTGGLLRERDLLVRQHAFDLRAWRAAHGASAQPGEQVVSLFCYDAPALPALLDQLAEQPTLLLATTGHAARQVSAELGAGLRRGALRAMLLPSLTQHDYDHLLWASDLNVVRGEDSFVRAQWAGKPFVWHVYPQHDGAHAVKLDAFLAQFLTGASTVPGNGIRAFSRAWNGGTSALPTLPPAALPSGDWRAHCERWRADLLQQTDLTTQLLGFVAGTR
jgi:uncharacterized repeat protein (TIGR03837 family)